MARKTPRRTTVLTLTNDLEVSASYVRLLVGFPRGSLTAPKLLDPGGTVTPPRVVAARENEIELVWKDPEIAPGASIRIAVESDGTLLLARATWAADGEPCLAQDGPASDGVPGEPGRPEPREEAGTSKDCDAFFAEYDRRFLPNDVTRGGFEGNPDMTQEEQALRRAALRSIIGPLVRRRDARAEAALKDGVPLPGDLPRPDRDLVEHLSEAQLQLYRECFPDDRGDISYERLQLCFEGFANGELRTGRRPGEREPDGGYFFLFAEFAFLARAMAVDPGPWGELLRTFVKTQEIFIEAYHPGGTEAPEDLDEYRAGNFREDHQADERRKERLREEYDDLSPGALERKARDNMRAALSARF